MGLGRQRSLWSVTAALAVFAIVWLSIVCLPRRAYAYLPGPVEIYVPTDEDLATGYIPDYAPAPSIHDEADTSLRGEDGDLPTSYDSRTEGFVTSVKNQNPLGTCWAFAVLGTLESSLVRQGKAGATLDLSERQLIYFQFHAAPDPLGNTEGDTTVVPPSGSNPDPYLMAGSNFLLAFHHLATWMGAADEQAAPTYEDLVAAYRASDNPQSAVFLDEIALDPGLAYTDAFHLTEVLRIPIEDTGDIKRAIMRQGAVGVSIRYSTRYRNPQNGAYYTPQKTGEGHAVVAVGWDDEYSRDNFIGTKPSSDGAWICKNSYGTDVAGGYLYISYEDAMLTSAGARVYAFDAEQVGDPGAPDNIYQYDGTSGTCMNYIESGGSIANVFSVRANEGGCERLTAVSLSLSDANVRYRIQVYANPTDPSDPTSGTAVLAQPVEGTTSYAGYHTIGLGEGAVFDEGDTFAVVATLSKKDGSEVLYDVDCSYGAYGRYSENNYWYHCEAHVEPGQSFEQDRAGAAWDDLSSDAYDTRDEPACSARLKAFTANESLEQAFDLSTAQVQPIGRQRYIGKELTPDVVIVDGNEVLRKGRDYRVEYASNVEVGTAQAKVVGTGRYTGELTASFEIYAEPSWDRLWGQVALDTMRAILQTDDVFDSANTDTVVVATADGYKDALAAAGLAGRFGAPVLITASDALSSQARAELLRLDPGEVVVAGGPVAVSDETLAAIGEALPHATVRRVFGRAAVDTALELWRAGSGWGDTAIVATSNGYKDALSIAPYAYAKAAPIFLANPSDLPGARVLSQGVCDAITQGGFSRVVIVGGRVAVAESVDESVRQLGIAAGRTIEVVRLPGSDAIDTSRLIGAFELAEGMQLTHMAVATTTGYKDALCGAALAGAQNSVLVLAGKTDGFAAFDALYDRNLVVHGHVLGGRSAISEASWDHITTR